MNKKHIWITIGVILLVLILDQTLKIWVKTHMLIGESSYTNWNWDIKWFQILFVENKGMAFGWQLPGDNGKLILTIFRIIIIGLIVFYLIKLMKKQAPLGLLITFGLIIAGAAGNIIDSMFYGLIFSQSQDIITLSQNVEPAKFVAFGQGYASFLHGNVVDMLYFPLFSFKWPNFLPFIGGSYFTFFEPIFNIADSSITIGVIILLVFSKRWFKHIDVSKSLS